MDIIQEAELMLAFTRTVHGAPRVHYRHMLAAVNKLVGEGAKTLVDFACGDGYMLILIYEQCPELQLTGIDSSILAIHKPSGGLGFRLIGQDLMDFHEECDVATVNLSLDYFENPVAAIHHMASLARFVVISDQLRPATIPDLRRRIIAREIMLGEANFHTPQQAETEISRAFSEDEFFDLMNQTRLHWHDIYMSDDDFYERIMIVLSFRNQGYGRFHEHMQNWEWPEPAKCQSDSNS